MTLPAADPDLPRRTIRKLDLILLPFLSILFLVNSLDRSNIGNAETANFTRDTGLEPEDLNDAVAWFFVFFVALQPFGAAAGRKFGMSVWVPSVMTLWGICTLLHVWVRSRAQLIVLRAVIGVLEAGFYPTTVSYLSLFYTRYEFGRRLGLFYGSYGVAGAVGGVIAYVVFSKFEADDSSGDQVVADGSWRPWQILFLVEGILTVVIALVGFFWLPKNAGSAWFLTAEEGAWAEERIRIDRETSESKDRADFSPSLASHSAEEPNFQPDEDEQTRGLLSGDRVIADEEDKNLTADSGLSRPQMLSTILFLPLIIPILILNIATAIPATGFSIFLPLVLSSMNLSSPLHSNVLTAPPFLLASVMLYVFTYWSDKTRRRIIPILASLGIIILGLSLTLLISSSDSSSSSPLQAVALYLSLCILLSGSYIPSPLTVAWFAGNIPDPGKRAIVLGINGYGNLAGVLSAYIFSSRWHDEGYRPSFWITLAAILASCVGFFALRVVLLMINDARTRLLARWPASEVENERISGLGRASSWRTERVPAFATIGGTWWDRQARYWFGRKMLAMGAKESQIRRGDERFTFQYGL